MFIQKFFFIGNYLLIILVGLYHFNKFKNSLPLKLFLVFLFYSFLTELLGTIFGHYLKINTTPIYNTWDIVNVLFYAYFFSTKIKSVIKLNSIKIFIMLYLILIFINLIYYQTYTKYYSYTHIFGKILISIIIMMFYAELLKSNEILNIKYSLFFWVSLGVLIYDIVFTPVFVIAEYISFRGVFKYITFSLNSILSLCFITGFILSKKEYNI